ncbi:MAG: hypothetical protein PHC66_01610 [Candidatus Nanoarchaeia archaeon]|nr:hypothetical protein [Candidatus Nanoarchaeia archaeon]MDD5239144.1 hypothetical protein [Candidatus Nanoarchaeia archaeon]
MNKVALSGILFLAIILVLGCTGSETAEETEGVIPTEENVSVTTPIEENVSITAPEIFDAKILSLTCDWTTRINEYNIVQDIVRVIARGTAQGPVEARLELPILVWSTDKIDCGDWTYHAGALIAVGGTCRREAADPEMTNWTIDTEEQSPLKSYWDSSRSYSIELYEDGDIYSKTGDSKSAVCNG